MEASVIGNPSFQSLHVQLNAGEHCYSEAGKMVRCSPNINVEVQIQKKGGGLFGAVKRMLSSDSFFSSVYTAEQGQGGEVVVAPTMMGNVHVLQLNGSNTWITSGGAYLASGPEVVSEAKWQGLGAGLLGGESLLYVHNTGVGFLAVEAFGTIHTVDVDGDFIVDTGHLVAFENSLEFKISKVGGSWMTSFLSGEGFVMNFKGRGKLLMQSHNGGGFGSAVGPMLPTRRA
jgi:uncharacterized protein (TIGR00266 family)